MPELPEVETVRKYLESNIINQKVTEVTLFSKKSLRNVKEKDLQRLVGQSITSLDRKAKHLIIRFKNDYIICHLRMEGKFFIFNSEKEMNDNVNRNHDVLLIRTNKSFILFQDTRKFATVDLFDNNVSYEENNVLIKVAPEPFDLDAQDLFNKLSKKRVAIKSALLDQGIISGIGNIYVDEILFATKLHPLTPSNEVTLEKCKEIIKESRRILKKAIELKGTTIKSYTSSLGVEGEYQKFLKVHQKLNSNCKTCNTPIVKIKVGGRGTYLCPSCQKNNH